MKDLKFTKINTSVFNAFLGVIFPLITITLTFEYVSANTGFQNLSWIFSLECLQLIGIIICYAVPISYFLTKIYELSTSADKEKRSASVLGFIACCVLILPLLLVCLALLANLTFVILIVLTLLTAYLYIRSIEVHQSVDGL